MPAVNDGAPFPHGNCGLFQGDCSLFTQAGCAGRPLWAASSSHSPPGLGLCPAGFAPALGLAAPVPTPRDSTLCPPTAARRGATSQTCAQSRSPEQPRSPRGCPASLRCNHTASQRGYSFAFPHVGIRPPGGFYSGHPPQLRNHQSPPPPLCLARRT